MELLIAISFLGLVVLSAVAVNTTANRFLVNQNNQVRIANQAENIMDLIVKDIVLSFGDPNNKAFEIGSGVASGILIKLRRFDVAPEGPDVNDRWVSYKYINNKIEYNSDFSGSGSWVVLTPNAVSLNFQALDVDANGNALNDNVIKVTLTCRQNPAQPASANNSEVTLTTTIRIPSLSS